MKSKKKSSGKWKYDFDFIPYEAIDTAAEKVEEVFICAPTGICQKENKSSVIENLSSYLNKRGEKGWELIQLFPQKKGLLLVFKKREA